MNRYRIWALYPQWSEDLELVIEASCPETAITWARFRGVAVRVHLHAQEVAS